MAECITKSIQRSGARDLAVDVYASAKPALEACVILLHCGAWMVGHRSDMAPFARALAKDGFTCVAAEYRLSGEAQWPAQWQDVLDVIAWVKREAGTLGVSPDKIALLGGSAGGHLALMAAPNVAAVVAVCAPPELRLPPAEAGPNPIAALLGSAASESVALEASPLTHVSSAFPPVYLIGGGRDTLVPAAKLLSLFAALEAVSVPVELHIFHSQAHAFDLLPSMIKPLQAEISFFLKRAIVDPGHYARENEELNPFARSGPPSMPQPVPQSASAA